MTELKYIAPEQAKVIEKLLNACLQLDPNGYFEVWDTEDDVCTSRKPSRILREMDGGDEEFGIEFYGADEVAKGWFGILPYEDAESVIYDHSDNEFCNTITAGI